VCDATRDRDIPRDWQHIVGHGQLQPANRTDPGPRWPWIAYVHRVQALCGEIVVDDSAQFNDTTVAGAAVPATWVASDTTPDFYGAAIAWPPTNPNPTAGPGFSFRVAPAGTPRARPPWPA